ncbi:MAG: fibronectin type III domain-containing protein [Actinomycetota bacterium]|nr:fibronectin type III domain-containing protein [Actinomycetota bacterium]
MKPFSLRMAAIASMAALSFSLTPMLPASASVGDTVPVEETDIPIVITAPYPPDEVVATGGSGRATVTWNPPADDGGSPIDGYQVEHSADDGVTWSPTVQEVGAGTTSTVITGLENGTAYVFRVAALSSAGVGGWSEPSEAVTPQGKPKRPTVVSGLPGDRTVFVTWVPPADDGGSPVTGFLVDHSLDLGKTWVPASPVAVAGDDTSFMVADLTNEADYRFRVAALNSVGQGSWSYPSPVTVPSDNIPVTVPKGFRVERDSDDPDDLRTSWKRVAGAHHYTVSVFDGATDTARVVDTESTTLRVAGTGFCNAYKVLVAAVDKAGTQARTGVWRVDSAAPGGIRSMSGSRNLDGTTGTLTWAPPANTGHSELTGYDVTVTRMADGVKVVDTEMTGTTLTIPDMDPARLYAAKVTAQNSFGGCITGTHLFNNTTPGSPVAFSAVRDPASPTQVNLSWEPPLDSGTSDIVGYEVGYGTARVSTWVSVTDTTLGLTLDPYKDHVFLVRAINTSGAGQLPKAIKLRKVNAELTPAVDPSITVTESEGSVTVTTSEPVGSNTAYPKLVVAVRPAISESTFADTHEAQNGATTVIFTQIPCGVYTVTVTGTGGTAGDKEFGRRIVNHCDVGLITQDQWRLVYGRNTISGNTVDHNYGNEARTISTTERTSQDAVFSTVATLNSGWGYGIWLRASVYTGASISGYSFQYDPGYENVNPGFGKALLLRLWTNGRECGNPIAKVKWPKGLEVNAPHRVTAVIEGDQLYATIDNVNLFSVPSLTDAVSASGCGMPAPTGTEVGFRTWSSSGKALFERTTLS